ncbi:MAG: GGDEF domain-containing protein [Roseburia sp.]|nr:GGDEF domain-containing protein [Roseburia sp.]
MLKRNCSFKDQWKGRSKKVLKIIWIIYAIVSVVWWLPQVDKLIAGEYASISQYLPLDDAWDIAINETLYENVSLETFRFPPVRKGDTIVMERRLPETWDMTEGTLRFHVRQTAMKLYIDEKMVYEYGYQRMAQNKTVGSGFRFINFPSEYQGKTLRINLYVSEDRAFSRLDSIRIYEWENAYRVLMTENRYPLLLGCFYLIFGLTTCVIMVFALTFSLKYVRLLCISAFCICMGLWTLCYYNVVLVFSIPLYSVSLIEYMAFYLAPLPLVIYMWGDVKQIKNKPLRNFYWVLLTVQVTATAVMIGLHATDTVHCAATLKYMQMLILCCLIYFMLVLLLNLKGSSSIGRLYLIGAMIIGVCVSIDLLDYLANRYYGRDIVPLRGLSPFGVMIFVFILIGTFYANLTQKMLQETERNSLIKSAYTDELTQLHNRRYCVEHMLRIRENKEREYTVVCFDVNNLKTVNDTYGHAKGDVLIRSAADVIAETFGKTGMVARMGGDEFIAILPTAAKERVAALMEQFQVNLRRKNQAVRDLDISIACGCAYGNEGENDIEKVYQLADNVMYANKQQMKQEQKQDVKPQSQEIQNGGTI